MARKPETFECLTAFLPYKEGFFFIKIKSKIFVGDYMVKADFDGMSNRQPHTCEPDVRCTWD
jgi:hypothetical protein